MQQLHSNQTIEPKTLTIQTWTDKSKPVISLERLSYRSSQLKQLRSSLYRKRSFQKQSDNSAKLSQTIQLTSKQRGCWERGEVDNREQYIYFCPAKKYNYMRQIIDKYFDDSRRENPLPAIKKSSNPEQSSLSTNSSSILTKIRRSKNQKGEIKEIKNPQLAGRRLNRRRARQDELETDELARSRLVVDDTIPDQLANVSMSMSLKNSHTLPPIDEIYEDKEDENESPKYQSISHVNDSSADPARQNKVKLMENEIYSIEMVVIDGKASHKIKTYTQKGSPILSRQLKAQALGVESIWIQYKFDPRCLVSGESSNLKQLLYKVRRMDADSKYFTLRAKKYHSKLMANRCEQLKRVIGEFCSSMKRVEGKLINNKINTSNIFISKNENWRLGEWGFSSFRGTHLIQGIQFQNRLDPILKSQKDWFIPPEYMAPEIVRTIAFEEELDIVSLGSSLDIWSLGVALFEVITLIPVWIPQKCVVYGKNMTARSGILSVPDRNLKKMLKREQKLGGLMEKIMREECGGEVDSSVVQIVLRCVQYSPSNRLSYQEIIDLLKQ